MERRKSFCQSTAGAMLTERWHRRPERYYDGLIEIDLSSVECMIAPAVPSKQACRSANSRSGCPEVIKEIEEAGNKIKGKHGEPFSIQSHLRDGAFYVDQALVSGCSGGLFENIAAMADILKGYGIPGSGLTWASIRLAFRLWQICGAGDCRRTGCERCNVAPVYLRSVLRCDRCSGQ